jgi:hypothetical protein
MSDVTFSDLLDMSSDDVVKPQGCPEAWLTADLGGYTRDKSRSGTEYIEFDLLNLAGAEDNSDDILEKLNRVDFSKVRSPFKKSLVVVYWLTPAAMYHFSNMLDRIVGQPQASFKVRLPETRGQRVMFKVKPRTNDSGHETGETEVDGRSLTLAE